MSVLVCGGGGFPGLAAAEALLAQGDDVVLLGAAAPHPAAARLLADHPGRAAAAPADLRDPGALDAAMRDYGVDRVVFCQWNLPSPAQERRDPRSALGDPLFSALTALEAAQRRPARRILLITPATVLGAAARGAARVSEETAPRPDDLAAIGAFAAEAAALRLHRLCGLDAVILRIAECWGPWDSDAETDRDPPGALRRLWRAAADGAPLRLGRPGCNDWLYSRDLGAAAAMLLNAPRPARRLYHLGGPESFSLLDLAERLALDRPGLSVALSADPDPERIDPPETRPPLGFRRLAREFGFRPRFDLDAGVADWRAWERRVADAAADAEGETRP